MGLGQTLRKALEDLLDVRPTINHLHNNKNTPWYRESKKEPKKGGGLDPRIRTRLKQHIEE